MAKLYPPYIEGKLPAFIYNGDSPILQIPFQLNAAVGRNEFDSMAIIIKTVQTNITKVNGATTSSIGYDYNKRQLVANFQLDNFIPKVGQFYKVQIAFVNKDNELGYYSTVGIIKCTAEPEIGIEDLATNTSVNYHKYEYTGYYKHFDDKAEKAYNYKFELYDDNKQLIATSGELLHNSTTDTTQGESRDTWVVEKDLNADRLYYIKYFVNTINNYSAETNEYTIIKMDTVDINAKIALNATLQPEDGCVNIAFNLVDPSSVIVGSFVLVRASDEDNYQTWPEVFRFELNGAFPINKPLLWQDFTVQQGVNYKYAIQAYNSNNFHSNRLEAIDTNSKTNVVYVDFEDSFITDGKRQLRIRFNPKVSSFKSTILESKVNTLGGQFPFIFRNGNVEYKEFPISGLLSYIADENNYFLEGFSYNTDLSREAKRERTKTELEFSDSSAAQVARERQYKLKVMEWLNNGEPKIFRSPTEGNYIVHLMNVSLSPIDTLGRMLHNFNCNACEIAKYTFENLRKYNFIAAENKEYRMMSFEQINLVKAFGSTEPPSGSFLKIPGSLYFARLEDQYQGNLIVSFYYADGTKIENYKLDNATGVANIPILNGTSLERIEYKSGLISEDAKLTIGYYATGVTNIFSQVVDMTIETCMEEYMGPGKYRNLIEEMTTIKNKPGRFYRINLQPRPTKYIYTDGANKYFEDSTLTAQITEWIPSVIYEVRGANYWLFGGPDNISYVAPDYNVIIDNKVLSLGKNNIITEEEFNKQISDDLIGRPILKSTATSFESLTDIAKIEKLIIGTGVQALLVYQLKTIYYAIEETDSVLLSYKANIEAARVRLAEAEAKYVTDQTAENKMALDTCQQELDNFESGYLTVLRLRIEAHEKEGVIYAL